LFVLMLLSNSMTAHAQTSAGNYRLGPGDALRILVFQEDDLSIDARISNDGSIDYPLIGQVRLSGLTLDQAESLLDKKLRGDYLVDPQITISIVNYRPFFVSGEVRSPGSFEFRPGMTVRQAITIAGDFTDRASRSRIFLIREGDTSDTSEKVDLDTRIGPGDTITVKEAFF